MSSRIPLVVALLSLTLLARADDGDDDTPANATPAESSKEKKEGRMEATSPATTQDVFKNTGSAAMKVEIHLQVGTAAIETAAALPSGNVLCSARRDTSRFSTCIADLPVGNTLQMSCDLFEETSDDEWKTCTWSVTYTL